jgi:hypothetical protein
MLRGSHRIELALPSALEKAEWLQTTSKGTDIWYQDKPEPGNSSCRGPEAGMGGRKGKLQQQ